MKRKRSERMKRRIRMTSERKTKETKESKVEGGAKTTGEQWQEIIKEKEKNFNAFLKP